MSSEKPKQELAKRSTKVGLMDRICNRFGIHDNDKLLLLLKTTCKSFEKLSNIQITGALVLMDEYKLNPLLNELYVIPTPGGGVQPYVSVDGWNRIINEHSQFDGERTEVLPTPGEDREKFEKWLVENTLVKNPETVPFALQTYMSRKDRSGETAGPPEFFQDCYKRTNKYKSSTQIEGPWDKTPYRFLNHRSRIQCARLVFSFGKITTEDEAREIVYMESERGGDAGEGGIAGLLDEVQGKDQEGDKPVLIDPKGEYALTADGSPIGLKPGEEVDPDTGEVIPPEDSAEFRGEPVTGMSARSSGTGRVRGAEGSPLEQQRQGDGDGSLFEEEGGA